MAQARKRLIRLEDPHLLVMREVTALVERRIPACRHHRRRSRHGGLEPGAHAACARPPDDPEVLESLERDDDMGGVHGDEVGQDPGRRTPVHLRQEETFLGGQGEGSEVHVVGETRRDPEQRVFFAQPHGRVRSPAA